MKHYIELFADIAPEMCKSEKIVRNRKLNLKTDKDQMPTVIPK